MRLLFSFLLLILANNTVAADMADTPTGRVILTVSGAINTKLNATFDLAMLDALPQYTITTHTPWTQGLHTYRGFSAVDLLDHLGSTGTLLQITALNQYMTEVPLSDFLDNGAIFATRQDGREISVRNLGPIMVIYPFDEREELKSERIYGRSIWQVSHIKSIVLTE
ncbi:oxidoreductase [Marinomonas pontica]|jgi:hypothetical protein|uniref:Oxidoreductase n=1 Tax=Marinomonas pontica TaxID=264739 RepID=A0ABM8FJ31_9GAMM|nr:hypothetical protein [Marinomonas pontica]MCW8354629.1 hypothetical protein [Marinomonas pontica]BDX04424.1 oxidoreductase [Marinomonas pontica]